MANDVEKQLKAIREIERKEAKFEEYTRGITQKVSDEFKKKLREIPSKSVVKIVTKNGKTKRIRVTVIDAQSKDYKSFLAGLPAQFQSTLKEVGYTDKAVEFTDLYGEIEDEIVQLHDDLSNVKSDKKKFGAAQNRLNSMRQNMVDFTINNLLERGGELEAAVLPEIKKALNNAAMGQADLFSTIDSIGDVLAGDGEVDGIFARNATRIARDSFYQYQGAINQTIAVEFEMNAYRYIGSIVEETRAQCERWVEQEYILFSELQAEIDWAFTNGSGMIKETDIDTFGIYRGGWNCRHLAIPVFYEPDKTDTE
jgi:hypothetical protein